MKCVHKIENLGDQWIMNLGVFFHPEQMEQYLKQCQKQILIEYFVSIFKNVNMGITPTFCNFLMVYFCQCDFDC